MKPYRILSMLLLLIPLVLASVAASPRQGTTPPWATGVQPSSVSPQLRTPEGGTMSEETLRNLFPKLSAGAQEVLAPTLGITSLAGKRLYFSKATDMDNIVTPDGLRNENEPSLAVNPVNESIVVAFFRFYSTSSHRCRAMVSYDGGDTFNSWNVVEPPLQGGGRSCANPVVRFSPDGQVAYYFYMDINPGPPTTADIVMVRADGYNPTVLLDAFPVVVLDDFGDLLDKPWADVAYYDTPGASDAVIYVTATFHTPSGGCGIVFNASTDYGNTWTYGNRGATLTSNTTCNPTLQGSRPIGSPVPGWVTACWYNSENDGYLSGVFDIRCWSNDNWGSGGNSYFFTPVDNQKYELSFYLPNGSGGTYHRWWGGMFPALAVDNTGLLYIAYTADPNSNPTDKESGNVFLARGWPNGLNWKTQPLGTGSFAQGFPTVAARCDTLTSKCNAYVAYGDYFSNNLYYKIVYRKASRPYGYALPSALSLGPKKTISDVPSFSDGSGTPFIGDYIDSFVTSRRYEVIWTDRSDVPWYTEPDDDVMHDVLLP